MGVDKNVLSVPSVSCCCEKAKIATTLSPKQFSLKPVPSFPGTARTLPSCSAVLSSSWLPRASDHKGSRHAWGTSPHMRRGAQQAWAGPAEIRHYADQCECREETIVFNINDVTGIYGALTKCQALCYLTESSEQPDVVTIIIFPIPRCGSWVVWVLGYLTICVYNQDLRLGYLSSVTQLVSGRFKSQT